MQMHKIIAAALMAAMLTAGGAQAGGKPITKAEADAINRQKKAEAAKKYGFGEQGKNRSNGSNSSKTGASGGKKSGYACDDRKGDGAGVAKPSATAKPLSDTDGECFEAWSVDENGRPIYEVWKDTNHVGGSGEWERIYWRYDDMD